MRIFRISTPNRRELQEREIRPMRPRAFNQARRTFPLSFFVALIFSNPLEFSRIRSAARLRGVANEKTVGARAQ